MADQLQGTKINAYAGVGPAVDTVRATKITAYALIGPIATPVVHSRTRVRVIMPAQTVVVDGAPVPPSTPALTILGTPSPVAGIGVPYSFTPVVTGGVAPYAFSLHAGTLPAGLTLNTSTGTISGTISTVDPKTGLVERVTDSLGATSDLAAFSITPGTNVTPATFVAAVAAASPGDILTCAAGAYGAYSPNNTVHIAAPGVSIYGPTDAVFTSISINTCSGIALHGFTVTGKASNGYAATCTNSQRITFDGMNLDSGSANGNGFQLRGSLNANISITNNRIANKGEAISTLDGDTLTISGNSITLAGNDGMLITGGSNISVTRNFIGNPRVSTGHPDAIQFSTSFDTGARPTNVLIQYNNFYRPPGAEAQFIFLERCDNVTIDSNAAFGSMVNGVSISACNSVAVTNTFVQGYDQAAKFIVRGASDTVSFTTSFATTFENYAGSGANTNVTISGNTTQATATSSTDRADYLAFLANNLLIPTS